MKKISSAVQIYFVCGRNFFGLRTKFGRSAGQTSWNGLLLDDRLEFVGRVGGEHIDGRCGQGEEVLDDGGREGVGGLEVGRLHVAEDAVAQLAGDDAVVEVGLEVHRRDDDAAAADTCFEQQADFARKEPCVDVLHRGLEVVGKLAEQHHLRLVGEFPPLQVAVVVGGKVAEEGVCGVDVEAGGVWRSHLEPRRVPEDGGELLDDACAVADFACRQEQHVAAPLEHLQGAGVEGVGHVGLGHAGEGVGIDPEVPVVAGCGGGDADGECQFGWGLNGVERDIERGDAFAQSHGQGAEGKVFGHVESAAREGAAECGAVERFVGELGNVDGGTEGFALAVGEPGQAGERHNG